MDDKGDKVSIESRKYKKLTYNSYEFMIIEWKKDGKEKENWKSK